MGLVSGLYRLAPSDSYPNDMEKERKLKDSLQRLVNQYGEVEVMRRIREHKVTKDMEATKSWLYLAAFATEQKRSNG